MRHYTCDAAPGELPAERRRDVLPRDTGSRHWLGVLVNTWMAVAPMAVPRAGAVATPPLVETCAPEQFGRRPLNHSSLVIV